MVRIIEKSKKKNYSKKINPSTKTFQALRIFVNKEISELINGIIKATKYKSFKSLDKAIEKTCLWAKKYHSIF